MEYKVIIGWDDKNKVFFVVESDVEGLWLEHATFEGLVEKIKDAAPDLIRHNAPGGGGGALRLFREVGEPVAIHYAA